MSNAAIYLHPNGYDTSGQALLGRHSAGESFLRGLLRHADVDRFHFWNVANRPQAELESLVARIEPPRRPVTWIPQTRRDMLAEPGVLNVPSPEIDAEAWLRMPWGARRYALCGLTHTTATATVMRLLPDLLIAPLEDHDALICTSTAVREAVETQLTGMREYMADAYGPRRRPEPQRVTIPLGVNVDDFAIDPAQRTAWRARLDIPEDAVVVLYVGRFNVRGKMNPAVMAMALERAAQRTRQPIYWVNSGWIDDASAGAAFHDETRKLCPSVQYREVDGRPPDVRFSIWSVADLFISLSDNIQETFGLTPVEAMAAGLPCVVTDWNGYKDTVRDGVDGFRIPTVAPRPGYGGDLAYWFANRWITYDNYVGAAAQYTAVDLERAATALATLIDHPQIRRTMGDAARLRAREVFDWAAIIPQYQALWAEQKARLGAKPPEAIRPNPYRPDPYTLFGGYPSRHIAPTDLVSLNPEFDWASAYARLEAPLAVYSRFNRPTPDELRKTIELLATQGPVSVDRLRSLVEPGRRNFMERWVLWMARHDIVSLRQET
ncbi:MAG: glycosyltransferase family 4 protein [Phenylobacterium sp.]|nr:glycosyltransferase family 4 protein [Phenylobacterium sp.]